MPFRFHKSRKLLPGVRLNVSKSGIGASIGPKGLRMSVGPRGIRTTQSIPGTGMSFIQQRSLPQMEKKAAGIIPPTTAIPPNSPPPVIENNLQSPKSKRKRVILIIIGAIVGIFILCMIFGSISSSSPSGKATSTARSLTLTAESIPTKTPFPTETPQPVTPTQTEAIFIGPETPTQNAFCDCQKDYNCSDFNTHQQAQNCFNSCGGNSSTNWSDLDGTDSDGIVCESLP